jgi:hypothetical protein
MIEVGTWVKYIPENGVGYVTNIEFVTGEVTIYWLDLDDTTIEMSNGLVGENFELLGKPTPQEELFWKMKYA